MIIMIQFIKTCFIEYYTVMIIFLFVRLLNSTLFDKKNCAVKRLINTINLLNE